MNTKTKAAPALVYDEMMLGRIIDFLNEIGIKVKETALKDDCFLPGLFPKESGILLDRTWLKYPGDLLHEAGHVAVTEAHLRPLIGTSKMPEQWPKPGDELGAILWSYAALLHLEIPARVVFHPDGYKGDADWLIEQFENKNYIGLPLLTWMGFCKNDENQPAATTFPKLEKWLR